MRFVPGERALRGLGHTGLLVVALLLAASPALAVEAGPPLSADLELQVLARAVAAGEPLQIVVRSPVPLAEVEGDLGGEELAFQISAAAGATVEYRAWAMVGLLEERSALPLSVTARARSGRLLRAGRELVLEARDFPVERLDVEPRFVEPPAELAERLAKERARMKLIAGLRSDLPWPREPFLAPVPGGPTSRFGVRRVFNGKPRSPHPGLDLRAAVGTPVQASGAGQVVLAAELYYSGRTVVIDHGAGLFTLYAHLDRIDVRQGEQVARGGVIGLSGATGRVTGPHLHWGAKIGSRPFDPRALLDPALFSAAD